MLGLVCIVLFVRNLVSFFFLAKFFEQVSFLSLNVECALLLG